MLAVVLVDVENIRTGEGLNIGGWRKLDNGELHNLCSSPSIIRTIESRRIEWEGHATRMEKREMPTGFWWESQK
jgi:hypothetical protein